MKTLMYPLGPDDDFPDAFCAIRQGSGEHMFYTPVGESMSQMLPLSGVESEDVKLRELILDAADMMGENAKLRELAERLRAQLADVTESTSRVEERCAKLRKLLLDVWNDAMQFDGFWDYVNDDGEIYNEDELPHYYDRMRELGIEVDG